MKNILWIAILFILFSGFSQRYKKFPAINYVTTEGKNFTNENFKGKNTVVVLFHLGCPPAMALLKDIETTDFQQNGPVEFIGILENTPGQIREFNDTKDNDWSSIRENFQLNPVRIPLIGECESEKVNTDDPGNTVIGMQCRNLADKIKTRYSPTIVFVNSKGDIVKIKRGHPGKSRLQQDIDKYLLNKKYS